MKKQKNEVVPKFPVPTSIHGKQRKKHVSGRQFIFNGLSLLSLNNNSILNEATTLS